MALILKYVNPLVCVIHQIQQISLAAVKLENVYSSEKEADEIKKT